jgi:hypothetical protein
MGWSDAVNSNRVSSALRQAWQRQEGTRETLTGHRPIAICGAAVLGTLVHVTREIGRSRTGQVRKQGSARVAVARVECLGLLRSMGREILAWCMASAWSVLLHACRAIPPPPLHAITPSLRVPPGGMLTSPGPAGLITSNPCAAVDHLLC